MTSKLVSIPSFSAFAISASAALISIHFSMNSAISLFLLDSSIEIGWFGDIAKKETPKIVSGLVEKVIRDLSEP